MDKKELKSKALEIVVSMNVRDARKTVRSSDFVPLLREVIDQEENRDGRSSVIDEAEKRIRALSKGDPKKVCPSCKVEAYSDDEVEFIFGYRNMKSGKKTIRAMQSYCRSCRSAKAKKRRQAKSKKSAA